MAPLLFFPKMRMLSEGAVPDGFKSAVVTPLIKKSSSKDGLKNYRSVSGLSFISKLVERVVASQLSRHVSLHGFENENQSLLSIKNQIHLSLARGKATAVVLLDQSAAFDTTDHDKLLDCLRKWFGVSGVHALTGSSHTFLIAPNASRLVLFSLRLESLSLGFLEVQFKSQGESLIPSDAFKNLGVWFDSDFSFTKHVKSVCKLCFIQIRDPKFDST